MEDDRQTGDPASIMAGEYVLGVLSAEERRDVERRLERDPRLAREVDFWTHRFAPLLNAIPLARPSMVLKEELMERLFGREAPRRRRRGGLFQWQILAACASAVAIVAVGALSLAVLRQEPAAPVAIMASAGEQPAFLVRLNPDFETLEILNADLETDGRDPELWVVPEGEQPSSLGLIRPAGNTFVALDDDIRNKLATGVTLAVSLEPPGGSPTGQPTGPIVVTGQVQVL